MVAAVKVLTPQWHAMSVDRYTADQAHVGLDRESESGLGSRHDGLGRRDDLRPNSIAGQQDKVVRWLGQTDVLLD